MELLFFLPEILVSMTKTIFINIRRQYWHTILCVNTILVQQKKLNNCDQKIPKNDDDNNNNNHKVRQVNITLGFLGGYKKQLIKELEKLSLNKVKNLNNVKYR